MFLKDAKLKKIIKREYKKGVLRLGDMGERLYISGSCWIIIIKKTMIPKTLIAALYETAGELPEDGTSFLASRGGNQLETEWVAKDTVIMTAGHMKEAVLTDVLLEHLCVMQRVIQMVATGDIMLLDEEMVDMIDMTEIDRDNGETEPIGPLCNSRAVCWENNAMTFLVCGRMDEKHEELLKKLETFRLDE